MKNQEKSRVLFNYSPEEIANLLTPELEKVLLKIHHNIESKKSEEAEKPISMAQASDFVGICKTTFSKLVGEGKIPFYSLNPDNPKAKKMFYKKDLIQWIESLRSKTIYEIRGQKKSVCLSTVDTKTKNNK